MAWATWARILGGRIRLDDSVRDGEVVIEGDENEVMRTLDVFDVDGLRSVS